MYAHNNYIELLVDIGIVGIVIYYLLYLKIIWNGVIASIKVDKKNFILLGLMISFLVCEYGLVTYCEAVFQLILMILFLFFDFVKKERKNNNDEVKLYEKNN